MSTAEISVWLLEYKLKGGMDECLNMKLILIFLWIKNILSKNIVRARLA